MAAIRITRRRPIISESIPAGKLTTMPTTVEAAAINPTVPRGTSRARIKRGSTGLLDIVELKIASPPIIQRIIKGDILIFIGL